MKQMAKPHGIDIGLFKLAIIFNKHVEIQNHNY